MALSDKRELAAGLMIGAILSVAMATGAAATTYELNIQNLKVPGMGPYGTVNVILDTATEATITFTSDTALGYYFLGNGSVAVNSNGPAEIQTPPPITGDSAGTYSDGGSGQEDGFGKFSNTVNTSDGFGDRSSMISFNLTLNSGTWASADSVLIDNAKGFLAAAHVGGCDPTGCTSFLSTGFAGNGDAPGTIPEPSTWAMLVAGLGLIGALGWRRKRERLATL
jgi:hypothetical protein